jgi:MFS family permease
VTALLLLAVLVTFTAQQVLVPVLAPLTRRLGLTEVQLGLVITTAALVLAVSSPLWGRAVDRRGPRQVLLIGLSLATVGLVGFAVLTQTALGSPDTAATGSASTIWLLMLLTRGVLFGVGIAAVPVAALAAVSAATDSDDRTRAVSLLGAAQALSLVLGPAIGGLLSLIGLLGPVWVAPGLTLIALLVVVVLRPDDRGAEAGHAGDAASAAVRPWDRQLWPIFAAGFGLFLSLGMVQIVLGFLVQDRLSLSDEATAQAVGLALVVTGLALVAVQGVLVPRLRWSPARLVRAGAAVTALALLALAAAGNLALITGARVLMAVGLGLAIPGYTAAPTLLVGPQHQGRVAGWISATNGSTFVVGPTLGTWLYSVAPATPALVGAALAGTVALLATAGFADRTASAGETP